MAMMHCLLLETIHINTAAASSYSFYFVSVMCCSMSVDSITGKLGGISIDGRIGEGCEVTATHFDIFGLKYQYYGVTKSANGIPTYPKKIESGTSVSFVSNKDETVTENVVNLNEYPHCCMWKEKTLKHVTTVFFLCKNRDDANKVETDLKKGGSTEEVLPKIQNEYSSDRKFNNIALCGDLPKPEGGWNLDTVRHTHERTDEPASPGLGLVHHVTDVNVNDLIKEHPIKWTQIKCYPVEKTDYHGVLPGSLNAYFVSSTLYYGNLPTKTVYPSKNGVNGQYYHRINIPFEQISGQLKHIFYWCSAPSPNNVGQIHYLCVGDKEEDKDKEQVGAIKVELEKNISFGNTTDVINHTIFNNYEKISYNIVAVPK